MSEYNSNISNIFTSRNTLINLLKKSEYNTEAYENFTLSEIFSMERHAGLDFSVTNKNNSNIIIKYYLDKPLKPNIIQTIIDDLWSAKNNIQFIPDAFTIIIIVKDEPNASIMELVKQIFAEESIHIILYNIKRLLFNILEHSFVPEHVILSEDEEKEFRTTFKITDDNEMPTISRFDPVALAIFIKPNKICKINRKSVNAINSTYYRLCVNL